jgi:hypothetical protein
VSHERYGIGIGNVYGIVYGWNLAPAQGRSHGCLGRACRLRRRDGQGRRPVYVNVYVPVPDPVR